MNGFFGALRSLVYAVFALIGIVVIIAVVPAFTDPMRPAFPRQCSELTKDEISSVFKDIPLARLMGSKILEITKITDAGSTDTQHLKCSVEAFANTGGEMTLNVSTTLINGNSYIQVSLF